MRLSARSSALAAALAFLLVAAIFAGRTDAQAQVASGTFVAPPVFDARGLALAVFLGGSIDQLEGAAQNVGASGVWVQDGGGRFQLLVVAGPTFLKTAFTAAFPSGFSLPVAVTLVRGAGSQQQPTPSAAAFGATVARLTLDETNAQRTANGRIALVANDTLNGVAAAYSAVVFQLDPYISSPATVHSLDGEPWDRATRAGYRWAEYAENAGMLTYTGTSPDAATAARAMVSTGMNSPLHRDNILYAGYTETGVGCTSGRPTVARQGAIPDLLIVCVAVYARPR